MPPRSTPSHLKMKPTPTEKQTLSLKNEVPIREVFPRKWKSKKSETATNTCVSLIKQHWKKLAKIRQKRSFLIWSIQNFIGNVNQFVRKYYIAWFIDLANKLKFVIHWEKIVFFVVYFYFSLLLFLK